MFYGFVKAISANFMYAMPGPATRIGVEVQDLFNRFRFNGRRFTKYSFYCSGNVLESYGAIQESRDRDLIGRIERNGLGSSSFDCFVSQT